MSYQNPFATLKYAVEAVPFFDGNNIPLNYFIEGCEEAKSMLPEEVELQLTKIIRTRIIGEARQTIQDQFFNSISQLTSYLKQIYGPSKSVYQLQGELGCIYQKDEENVISYASRIRTLRKEILEAYQYLEKVLPDKNIKTSLEKNMCECFIRGLKSNIEQRITRNLNIEETIIDALRIERELREIANLRQKQDVNSSQNELYYTNYLQETCQICFKKGHIANNCRKLTQFSPQNYNETNLETKILICQICKKRGHSADNCRLRTLRYRQPINIIREEVISCQLCSESGHDAKLCPQNDINNQANKMSVICQWCEKPGHSAKNCWKKQNEEYNLTDKQQIICQICNNFGHNAKNCCSKINQISTSKINSFCRYCKEQGHLLKNCQLRIATNNYREQNNQKKYNNFSMSNIKEAQPDFKTVLENQADCRVINAQPVTINLDKRGRVPTIQINFKVLRNQEQSTDKKEEATHEASNKIFNEFDDRGSKVEIEDKTKNRQNEDYQENIIIKEARDEDKEEILNQNESKNKTQTQNKNKIYCENKLMNKNEKKNKDYLNNLNNLKFLGEGNYQTSSENINNPKILGEGNYQTFPKNVNDPKILGRGNYQTSPEEINNPKILKEGSFQAPPKRKNPRISEGNFLRRRKPL